MSFLLPTIMSKYESVEESNDLQIVKGAKTFKDDEFFIRSSISTPPPLHLWQHIIEKMNMYCVINNMIFLRNRYQTMQNK